MTQNGFRGRDIEGRFWLPANPEIVLDGVINIEENNHGSLKIRGPLKYLDNMPISNLTFFGSLAGGYRYDVTLFDVIRHRGPMRRASDGEDSIVHSELMTNTILIGRHVPSQEYPIFNGAILDITGLNEFCDSVCIKLDYELADSGETLAGRKIDVSFSEESTKDFDAGGGFLVRFLSRYQGPAATFAKSITIVEKNEIHLTFPDNISVVDCQREILTWQRFVSLAVSNASYMDSVRVLINKKADHWEAVELLVPGRREGSSQTRHRSELLFTLSGCLVDLEKYLKNWRSLQERLEFVLMLYNSTLYSERMYKHVSLLNRLQALEIFHREFHTADKFPSDALRRKTIAALRGAIPDEMPPELKEHLFHQMGMIGALNLADRLKSLFEVHKTSLSRIFPKGNEDMNFIKDVRNFLTHYGTQKFDKEFVFSRRIALLDEKIRVFLEVCLLGAMGVGSDDIFALLRHTDRFAWLSHEDHHEKIDEW